MNEFFKLFLRFFLTGGLLFFYSTSSQAFGKSLTRAAQLIEKASKTKGGDQLDELAKKIGVSIDEVDPRLIQQMRETGALRNPMRLFSPSSLSSPDHHPFTFKNIFYGPDESDEALHSVNKETWKFVKDFYVLRIKPLDEEQARLFFEGMKDFANRYGDSMDMDEAGVQLIYATGSRNRVEYEGQMGHLVESVVRWHGPEIQEAGGALEKLVESAWYKATTHIGFFFREDDNAISAILNNPFYETLLRRHFEPIMLSVSIQKRHWLEAWKLTNIFAGYGPNPRGFLLESIEGVLRTKLREALSGNYSKEAVEELFETNYEFQQLFFMARDSKKFAAVLEEVVGDFM